MTALACIAEEEVLEPAEVMIEAEDLEIESGWEVIRDREGYFPSRPGIWSGNRLRADESDTPARASKTFNVPRAGTYHLWTRYESPAGFDVLFNVAVLQKGASRLHQELGGRDQSKYFPFGRRWRVQGLWGWHNTDNAYQVTAVELEAGPAEIVLSKGRNGRPSAARVIDLFYLTDDLELQPGDDYPVTQSQILMRFETTRYIKLRVSPQAQASALVQARLYRWLAGGGNTVFYFTTNGITQPRHIATRLIERNAPNVDARPASGLESGWLPLQLPTVMPARLVVRSDQPAELLISTFPDGRDAVAFDITKADWMDEVRAGMDGRDLIIGTGQSRYEDRVLKGRIAVSMYDYLAETAAELEATVAPGRRARRLGLISAFDILIDGFDFRKVATAAGLTGQHYRMSPEVYHPDAEDYGFNRDQAYPSAIANRWVSGSAAKSFYEGDVSELRDSYRKRAEKLHAEGLGEIPQSIKLIEESGVPRALRDWDVPNQLFHKYLKEQNVRPIDILGREALVSALTSNITSEAALWEQVRIGTCSQSEAASNPTLYYHSAYFRAQMFADKCAEATRIIEEETGTGTTVNTGSLYVNFGAQALHGGVDPFLLCSRRGVSELGMGTSWGLGGTPGYLGPQTESYGAAVVRALSKYHDTARGCYLIADGNRGYTPEYFELAAYALAAGRYDWWSYYLLAYPDGCSFIGYPELLAAIRRTSYRLGPLEDWLLASDVVPARVALGWSLTTDIWDAAQQAPSLDETGTSGSDAPGNSIYPLERHYLYTLLRHLQQPVDILGEEDLTPGALQNYAVYFLVADHLRPEAAQALKEWVAAGGTLVSVAGAGMKDHLGRPLNTLKEVFGISKANLRKEARSLRAKSELVHAKPLDVIRLTNGATLSAYGYLQPLEVAGGQVLGHFRDGSPALVAHDYEGGHALLIGTLPGIGWLADAFPKIPYGRGGEDLSGYIFPDYNKSVQKIMTTLLEPYLKVPPVRCDIPAVEATLHRHRETGAYGVALVNFSGAPVEALRLVLTPEALGNVRTVRAQYGKVKQQMDNGQLVVTLPLDKFDYLHLE